MIIYLLITTILVCVFYIVIKQQSDCNSCDDTKPDKNKNKSTLSNGVNIYMDIGNEGTVSAGNVIANTKLCLNNPDISGFSPDPTDCLTFTEAKILSNVGLLSDFAVDTYGLNRIGAAGKDCQGSKENDPNCPTPFCKKLGFSRAVPAGSKSDCGGHSCYYSARCVIDYPELKP